MEKMQAQSLAELVSLAERVVRRVSYPTNSRGAWQIRRRIAFARPFPVNRAKKEVCSCNGVENSV